MKYTLLHHRSVPQQRDTSGNSCPGHTSQTGALQFATFSISLVFFPVHLNRSSCTCGIPITIINVIIITSIMHARRSTRRSETQSYSPHSYSQIVTVITSIKITGIKPNGKQNCNYLRTTSTLWWIYFSTACRRPVPSLDYDRPLRLLVGHSKISATNDSLSRKKGRNYPSYSLLLMCFPNH